jgi:hypothetical protein
MYVNINKEREEKTMKYETPQLAVLTPAISAIQGPGPASEKTHPVFEDGIELECPVGAYLDWE